MIEEKIHSMVRPVLMLGCYARRKSLQYLGLGAEAILLTLSSRAWERLKGFLVNLPVMIKFCESGYSNLI